MNTANFISTWTAWAWATGIIHHVNIFLLSRRRWRQHPINNKTGQRVLDATPTWSQTRFQQRTPVRTIRFNGSSRRFAGLSNDARHFCTWHRCFNLCCIPSLPRYVRDDRRLRSTYFARRTRQTTSTTFRAILCFCSRFVDSLQLPEFRIRCYVECYFENVERDVMDECWKKIIVGSWELLEFNLCPSKCIFTNYLYLSKKCSKTGPKKLQKSFKNISETLRIETIGKINRNNNNEQ